jgi:hypothetical protein
MSRKQILKKFGAMSPKPQKVPKDWLTVAQIASATGLSERRVREKVLCGIRAKSVARKEFKIRTENGAVRPVPHYRLK